MRLGLGLALASQGKGAAFSPASVAWTGWWTGDAFAAGTATGQASAGISGGRNLTGATPPTTGNNQNGHVGMIFDGVASTGQELSDTTHTLGSYISAGAYTCYCVAKMHAATGAAGSGWTIACVLTDTLSYWSFGGGRSTPSFDTYHLGGGEYNDDQAISLDTVYLFRAYWDGSNLKTGLNGGARSAGVAGTNVNATGIAGTGLIMGSQYNHSLHFNGTIYEARVTNSLLDVGTDASVIAELRTKYGV